MKQELQDILFKKYKKIFRQKDLSPQETSMCWGITVDNGYFWLINNLCACIQGYINYSKNVKQIEAIQVKQKFGGLRFYYKPYNEAINSFILFADSLSYNICEHCGSTNDVKPTKESWIQSLCKKCRTKK